MRNFLLILATFALMILCGFAAFVGSLMFLMDLGTRHHGNYEYYGQTPAAYLILVAAAVGFVAPGMAACYLYNRSAKEFPWRFSLRTLLIATTLFAVVLGFGAALGW